MGLRDRDVVLVDAGGTNIGSLQFALARLGVDARVSKDAGRIRAASHVILPGVGAARQGMKRLQDNALQKLIPQLTQPVLGVCLGMQLLYESSAEGGVACLGILPGRVEALVGTPTLRVPHMGWNRLQCLRDDALLAGVQDGSHAYFVHGFAAPVREETLVSSEHGYRFAAMVRRGNFCGMQFHPERSGLVGAQLLRNFLRLQVVRQSPVEVIA